MAARAEGPARAGRSGGRIRGGAGGVGGSRPLPTLQSVSDRHPM